MKPKPQRSDFTTFLGRPWGQFFIFVFLNAGLAWAFPPFSAPLRLLIGGIFILVLAMAQKRMRLPNAKSLENLESLPTVPLWMIALLAVAALGARLYGLTSIPVWPMADEGGFFLNAVHCLQKGDDRLYFTHEYMPAAFYWTLGLFLKLFPPSLTSLWLYPVLVSMATLALGYAACRQFFSKSFSILWALGWAFGFWPLYTSHFCVPQILLPLWACLCLLLFGLFRKARSYESRRRWSLWLGISLGAGFYIFFLLWVTAVLVLGLAFFLSLPSAGPPAVRRKLCGWFLGPLPLFLLPLLIARLLLPGDSHAYLDHLWAFKTGWDGSSYLAVASSYLTGLFWGEDSSLGYSAYKSFWGGFLNPVAGSLFFVGALQMFRRRSALAPWLAAAFGLFLLPSLLTNNLEMFRLPLLMPLLVFGMAVGFQALMEGWAKGRAAFLVGILGLLSFGLDSYNLDVAYPGFWKNHVDQWYSYAKQRECYDAYQYLENYQKTHGAGLILTEFTAPLEIQPKDQTLVVACYPFDASRNPALNPQEASWAALLVPAADVPYLRHNWPDLVLTDLGPDLYRIDASEKCFLAILPITPKDRDLFLRWGKADNFLEEMVYQSFNPDNRAYRLELEKQILGNYALFKGDPFLESHFWIFLAEDLANQGDDESYWQALQSGFSLGYPRGPGFYFLAGLRLFQTGHYSSAKQAYLTAARLDRRFTPPKESLNELDRLAKEQGAPR